MMQKLNCPACGAPIDAELLQSGEKIIACPYCNNAIETPEDRKEKLKDVLVALKESHLLDDGSEGGQSPMNVSVVSMSDEDKAALKKQFGDQAINFDDGIKVSHVKKPVIKTKVTYTTTGGGEVPPQVKKMLADMGINLPGQPSNAVADHDSGKPDAKPDPPQKKKSLLKKLFGK